MTTYAYLRVSTNAQDVNHQRHSVLEYANAHRLGPLVFVQDEASTKLKWRACKLGALLTATAQPGDVLLFAEVSRMARSTLQVLEILEHCAQREVSVHIAKQRMILDGSMQTRITATVLGLAAEIEREFIAIRTREALAVCRANGVTLGRPKGPAEKVKLDACEVEIRAYLKKGINKRSIAKLVNCAPSTLYEWMKRRNIKAPVPE